jgi:hypothetical protein
MLEFDTTLVPPPPSSDHLPTFTVPEVVRGVMAEDLEAERIIRFEIAPYQHLLVAHQGGDLLGFQLIDYDPHEMEIILGRQEIIPLLPPEEKQFLAKSLSRIALDSYEDLF